MKNKKIALNKLFNFLTLVSLLFIHLSIMAFSEIDKIWGFSFLGIGISIFMIGAIFTPCCYLFDKNGVTLCYVFLSNENYLWKNVYSITIEENYFTGPGRSSILEIFFVRVFSIKGKISGKERFYMKGNVRKSFRTNYLFKKYYDGEITGYYFENYKKKRKKKKLEIDENRDSSQVAIMEAEARKKARLWSKSYSAILKQYGYTLKTDFLYITDDFKELRYRPNEKYEYTFIAEIELPNLKENPTTISSVLLNVRLSKKSYLGVENDTAKEEIEFYLNEMCEDIKNNNYKF